MVILFPNAPDSRRRVDPSFSVEWAAAQSAGLGTALYSHESIIAGDSSGALGAIEVGQPHLLRGWMLTAEQYASLAAGIAALGATLIVDPEAYAEAHYLPLAYRHLWPDTPESIWMEGDDPTNAWELYQGFRDRDALIKDWVKSAKHRWREACFLPAGSDQAGFLEVFRAFRHARGSQFNRGVVFRRIVPLESRGTDLRGFPLVDELRLFFFQGELLLLPDARGAAEVQAALGRWTGVARRFRSPFVTLDVARLESGEWIIVEAGDGGVSGLPGSIDEARFYAALAARVPGAAQQ